MGSEEQHATKEESALHQHKNYRRRGVTKELSTGYKSHLIPSLKLSSMVPRFLSILALVGLLSGASAFSVLPSTSTKDYGFGSQSKESTSLQMVDQNIIMGAGVAFGGLAVGIGLVAFTENQGERAKERGSGLSERMSTSIAGGLLEDVEISSVSDLGSLTSQLESALRETGATDDKEFTMTEEEKKRIADEADDGW